MPRSINQVTIQPWTLLQYVTLLDLKWRQSMMLVYYCQAPAWKFYWWYLPPTLPFNNKKKVCIHKIWVLLFDCQIYDLIFIFWYQAAKVHQQSRKIALVHWLCGKAIKRMVRQNMCRRFTLPVQKLYLQKLQVPHSTPAGINGIVWWSHV